MKTLYITATAVAFACLLSGCSIGARVVETTGPNGTTINSLTVNKGTVFEFNPQTGLLCIDASGGSSCSLTAYPDIEAAK